jgi:hypothetical protein
MRGIRGSLRAGLTFGSQSGSGSVFCSNVGFRSRLESVSGLKKVVGFSRYLEKVVCPFFGQLDISLVFFKLHIKCWEPN